MKKLMDKYGLSQDFIVAYVLGYDYLKKKQLTNSLEGINKVKTNKDAIQILTHIKNIATYKRLAEFAGMPFPSKKQLSDEDRQLFKEKGVPLFVEWYLEQHPYCCYCGVPENLCKEKLQEQGATRQGHRGSYLEVEKTNPDKTYTKDNCVLACYLCNNAKTNFIQVQDFEPIARGIYQFWTQNKKLQFAFPEEFWKNLKSK